MPAEINPRRKRVLYQLALKSAGTHLQNTAHLIFVPEISDTEEVIYIHDRIRELGKKLEANRE